MNKIIRRWLARRKMPKKVDRWWYSGNWYLYRSEESDAGRPYKMESAPFIPLPPYENKFMFTPDQLLGQSTFDHPEVAGSLEPISGDDKLVAAIKVDGFIGWYRCVRRYRENYWYDGAPWDDGYYADMVLAKVTEEER